MASPRGNRRQNSSCGLFDELLPLPVVALLHGRLDELLVGGAPRGRPAEVEAARPVPELEGSVSNLILISQPNDRTL